MAKDVDRVLDVIGGYGRYQIRTTIVLGIIMFILTFQPLVTVFSVAEPSWRCAAGSLVCTSNDTMDYTDQSRCSMNRSDWEYTEEFNSIVTEWHLYCDRSTLATLAQSAIFIGWIFGSFLIGSLSDTFGRKTVMFPAVFATSVVSFACAMSTNYWMFFSLRMTTGIFQGGVYVSLFVLSTEYVGPTRRGLAGTLNWFFFASSLMTLSLLAYLIRDWKTLSIAVSAPALPLIFLWWFVPESCRWLLVNNHKEKAVQTFLKIAHVNKRDISEDTIMSMLPRDLTEEKHKGNVLDLFRPRSQLIRTLIMWFTWFTNPFVYYGVSLSSGALGGSLYLNFFLSSLIEFPANVFAIWFMERPEAICTKKFRGRKRALILCLVLAACCCFFVSLFPVEDTPEYTAGRVIFAVLGKFMISVAFSTIYVYSTELLPTVIRNVGMGSMAIFDQGGAISAPFIVSLNKINKTLPFIIMAVCSFICGVLGLYLPETIGQSTRETLDDNPNTQHIRELKRSADEFVPSLDRKQGIDSHL